MAIGRLSPTLHIAPFLGRSVNRNLSSGYFNLQPFEASRAPMWLGFRAGDKKDSAAFHFFETAPEPA
ncbi:MAG TPA: hypothetical protein VGN38_01925 [Caulobacteraceae bacterium]|jgi:hypothetical protein|nr:hypothetical protein [Caulobacteraceae bacterium]